MFFTLGLTISSIGKCYVSYIVLSFPSCLQAIKKRLRAINESRAQKRKVKMRQTTVLICFCIIFLFLGGVYKVVITFLTAVIILLFQAGQVYGVPLADSLLTKPGVFPEQRPCGEDLRKKWIEVCTMFS